jgi:hypothetical protein
MASSSQRRHAGFAQAAAVQLHQTFRAEILSALRTALYRFPLAMKHASHKKRSHLYVLFSLNIHTGAFL